jgi:hypothetical protein
MTSAPYGDGIGLQGGYPAVRRDPPADSHLNVYIHRSKSDSPDLTNNPDESAIDSMKEKQQ